MYFMTCPSPGQIARYLKNDYYKDDETYIYHLADIMSRNYRAIVHAGFVLQLDCPDLAMCKHTVYPDLDTSSYRDIIKVHVEALNHAVSGIPKDRIRMHVCWGSTMGPHHTDIPFKDIVDIVLNASPTAVSFPGANPRHGHEWKIWRDIELPDGKKIIPGVIDSTSNFVEHPELVADRICQYAEMCRQRSGYGWRGLWIRDICRSRSGRPENCLDEAQILNGGGRTGFSATMVNW